MKVIYVGDLQGWNTTYARFKGLKEIEDNVKEFNISSYFDGVSHLHSSIEWKVFCGPILLRANKDLCMLAESFRPDIIWVDKGHWIYPSTIKRLRTYGAFLVQHNTDSLYGRHCSVRWQYRLQRRALPHFDLYFTTNHLDHEFLCTQTAPRTELTYLGYDHFRFDNAQLPADVADKWASDLLFVGHYEPRTGAYILALLEAGLPVTVYGAGWEQVSRRSKTLQDHVRLGFLTGEEYVWALKGAKIGLCFLSERNGNYDAARSYEIPACGTFLLGMRTRRHMECYVEGKEAEFFGGIEELVQKAKFYLENDSLRRTIAQNGWLRCTTSDYSWMRYMRDDWSKVLAAFEERTQKSTRSRSEVIQAHNEFR
jgi:glycosyltransferase involved in cell wall biosynthesis